MISSTIWLLIFAVTHVLAYLLGRSDGRRDGEELGTMRALKIWRETRAALDMRREG